jgi:protein gp37
MAKKTKIQWCDSTVNPTKGCDGCELCHHRKRPKDADESNRVALDTGQPESAASDDDVCYANTITQLFGKSNSGLATNFWEVTESQGRIASAARWPDLHGVRRDTKPWLDGLPRIIFVSDMADALSRDIEFEYLKGEIVDNVASDNRHQWLWLTKRPGRMGKFSRWLANEDISWPSNLWAGTSVTTSKTTSRVEQLLDVGDENTLRFVSVEPQWEQIDLRPWLDRIGWVIQGGQSGKKSPKPFHLEWVTDMISQCREAKVPLFVKQLGRYAYEDGERTDLNDSHGGDWSEWPKMLRVRQMPIYRGRKKLRVRQNKVA